LEELAKLSKSKSPFGDPTEKIQDFNFQIKSSLNSIQHRVEELDNLVKSQKTMNDNSQVKIHSETLINALQNNLLYTTKAFTDTLEIQTKKKMKEKEEKIEKLTVTRILTTSPILPDYNSKYDNSDDGENDGEISISIPLMETQDNLLIQRRDAVFEIEQHIKQVREMFQKLATIVALQNESILRIEDNIEDVYVNVQHAQNNFLTYLQKVSSNRTVIIQVFMFLIFFIFMFFMFFV